MPRSSCKPAKKRSRSHRKKKRGRTANRYRAYPTDEQRILVRRFGGSCRFVKNLGKEQRDLAWKHGRHSLSYTTQSKEILTLRDDPEYSAWLSEVPAQVLQQALNDLNRAYQNFFNGHAGHPHWTRYSGWYSFRVPQHVEIRVLSRRWAEVRLQGLGWIRIRYHRPIRGTAIKSATVVMEPDGKIFVSLLTEFHSRRPTRPLVEDWDTAVGVDRGVKVAAAVKDSLGNADLIDRDMWTPRERERLKRLERERERKKLTREKRNREIVTENTQRKDRDRAPLAILVKSTRSTGDRETDCCASRPCTASS
ncbi:MAG: RNA-guided endonuclease InsQ/TnpB family protein [Acidimicrobiales bacterium]